MIGFEQRLVLIDVTNMGSLGNNSSTYITIPGIYDQITDMLAKGDIPMIKGTDGTDTYVGIYAGHDNINDKDSHAFTTMLSAILYVTEDDKVYKSAIG